MVLAPGTRLGPYEILGLLGRGGMGEVHRAHDSRLGRDVALKVLPETYVRDAVRLQRFEREARLLASLNHPNIVVIHSIEHDADIRFVTMEMVEGVNMARHIVPGGLPLGTLLELAIPVGEALAAAHDKGVVHRDLKPANVMVTRERRVKVLDFGLAKLAPAPETGLTQTDTLEMSLSAAGDVVGTPAYMSPEQIRGDTVNARSDLFAFGILLHELASGRPPFAGASAADVISAILRDAPPDLGSLRADLPAAFVGIVARCLEKDPGQRVQTARDVVTELRRLLRQLEHEAVGGSAATALGRAPMRGAVVRRWQVVAVVAVVATVAGWFVFHRRNDSRPVPAIATDHRTVAVLEFENLTGQPSLDWMKRGIAELLGAALVQSPELDVFDAQRLSELAAIEGHGEAAPAPGYAFLARHGIRRAISGAILQSGGELRIQGRIVDTGNGRPVHAYQVAGFADSGMFHLVGQLIPDLQVALEVNLTGDREAEGWLREITTTSADAYRHYLRGHQALLASRWKEAATAYENALELDSMFVAARTDLSGVYWNLGDTRKLEITRAAMRRLRGHSNHRDQLRIDLLESVVGGDPPGIVRAAAALTQLYPENRFYAYLLGRGYYETQQYQRCLEVLRPLVDQRYHWAWTYALSARSSLKLGDAAAARRTFELGLEATRDPELAYAYVRFLREHGDPGRVRPVVEEGLRSPKLAESPVAEGELRLELAKELDAAGDRAGAHDELRRAATLLPGNDEARSEADSLLRVFGVN